MTDSDTKALLQALEQSDWSPDISIFHLDLMFNSFTVAVLPATFAFLLVRDGVTVDVGRNRCSALDLQDALKKAKLSHWLGKRVFHKVNEISRQLSNTAVLLQRHDLVSACTTNFAKGLEQEVAAAVLMYLKNSVPLDITQIVTEDGSILCEWDGAMQGVLNDQAVLVFVEAKHCVKTEHLEPEMKKHAQKAVSITIKLNIMQDWLRSMHEPQPWRIPDVSSSYRDNTSTKDTEYKRYKGLACQGAIGGPMFDLTLQRRARKLQLLCVICHGSQYIVS